MNEAKDPIDFERLAGGLVRHEYELTETGGGCTALVKLIDGFEIMLTDGDMSAPDSDSAEVVVGIYDGNTGWHVDWAVVAHTDEELRAAEAQAIALIRNRDREALRYL